MIVFLADAKKPVTPLPERGISASVLEADVPLRRSFAVLRRCLTDGNFFFESAFSGGSGQFDIAMAESLSMEDAPADAAPAGARACAPWALART